MLEFSLQGIFPPHFVISTGLKHNDMVVFYFTWKWSVILHLPVMFWTHHMWLGGSRRPTVSLPSKKIRMVRAEGALAICQAGVSQPQSAGLREGLTLLGASV